MRKVFTAIEGFLLMVMLISIAGLDGNGGDICGVIAVISAVGLFVMSKVEEGYVFTGRE